MRQWTWSVDIICSIMHVLTIIASIHGYWDIHTCCTFDGWSSEKCHITLQIGNFLSCPWQLCYDYLQHCLQFISPKLDKKFGQQFRFLILFNKQHRVHVTHMLVMFHASWSSGQSDSIRIIVMIYNYSVTMRASKGSTSYYSNQPPITLTTILALP